MGSFHSGPRACIGMRFALIESVALLFPQFALSPSPCPSFLTLALPFPHSRYNRASRLPRIKALLFTLLRAFHFQHLDPKPEIYHALAIVARPMIKGRENEGGMLPLRVERVGR